MTESVAIKIETEAVKTKTGQQLVHQLAYVRQAAEAQAKRAAEAQAALEQLKMYQWAKTERELAREYRETMAGIEADLRLAALAAYGETGSPNPFPGVQIKHYTTIAYALATALDYCKREAPMFLTVDTKAWERAVKAMPTPPSFVEIGKEPRATIATDLRAYLEEPEQAE